MPEKSIYQPIRVGAALNEDDFGYVGVLNPKVSKSIDKRLNMVCLELDFGVLAGKHGFFKKTIHDLFHPFLF